MWHLMGIVRTVSFVFRKMGQQGNCWSISKPGLEEPSFVMMTRIIKIALANGLPTTRKKIESGILL